MNILNKLSITVLACLVISSCSSEDTKNTYDISEVRERLTPPKCKSKDELTGTSLKCYKKESFKNSYYLAYYDIREISFACRYSELYMIDKRYQSYKGEVTRKQYDYVLKPTVVYIKKPNTALKEKDFIGNLYRDDLTLVLNKKYYQCSLPATDKHTQSIEEIYKEELEKIKKDNKI